MNNITKREIKKIDKKLTKELVISETIRKIPFNYFHPILDSKRIFISNNDSSSTESEYILITKKEFKSFDLFANRNAEDQIKPVNSYIKRIIETYLCLLNSLEVLEQNRLCYLHFNERTIGFNKYDFPVLHDFSECFRYEDVYMLDDVQCPYLPLEYFVLSYLKINKSMSNQNMDDIIKKYVLYVKDIVPDLDDFERKCYMSIKKWINRDITQIDLCVNYWDVYSLHMFFLDMINNKLLNDIIDNAKLNLFIKFFREHLLECICPGMSVSKCRGSWNKIYTSIDWMLFV